ncbi:Crp/Fnr family transcriptional regulator [Cytophaga hutchinsonii]|uniref:Cyclic nucleotide binding regulatory protein n=1 Tax=Cytophaga hutchinsonii (strain ATCC 33406 / DSM 1761 / CIP 103989 / NBRC 15051 / NCIMB 9469 / D465) TaxID=269798 RepID=A0A6N4SMM4_CYTH3|nr:Crp/Fnr family transcriptional regulator [Cytophaga hutchinsonii]ABG57518.1 cyclic nucleotide binding regulatory protein [Cytophaga hutchinsonii ATCC 33406]SFW99012.1 cAMP-binding domain of CRP or a regulatory subunit of cAMP-dependent protein kinases [Cytophaga hutchinsonii ATCC 33406]
MEKLKLYFTSAGFDDADTARIIQAFTLRTFEKNELFVEYGKTSKYLGFVDSGMFQYYVLKDGEEKTSYISIENTFIVSLLSFLSGVPAMENIRALTAGSIFLISKVHLEKLVQEMPAFKNFYIKLLEASICSIDATRHDLIVLSGEQRYEKMLQQEPHLLQQIPLQYLASMLGITPRHLSRIRNKIR